MNPELRYLLAYLAFHSRFDQVDVGRRQRRKQVFMQAAPYLGSVDHFALWDREIEDELLEDIIVSGDPCPVSVLAAHEIARSVAPHPATVNASIKFPVRVFSNSILSSSLLFWSTRHRCFCLRSFLAATSFR